MLGHRAERRRANLSSARLGSVETGEAPRFRIILAGLLVAALGLALFSWYWSGRTGHPDFDQVYYAAIAIRSGVSPYAAVGPHARFQSPTPFYYPLPTALVIAPLTVVGVRAAALIFVGVSCFALGAAVEKTGERGRYLLVASRGFVACCALGQWSTLMLAAAWIPVLGVFGAAKPNVALVSAAHWSRKVDFLIPALGSFVLIAISFAVRPTWVSEWRTVLGNAPYQRSPILYPLGFVALAAIARWRRPEARCLLAYAIVPQTPGPYTDFMLFTVPRGAWEAAVLSLLSYAPFPIVDAMGSVAKHIDLFPRYAGVSNCVLLLPCVVMLLRRPNEGPAPAWLERRVAGLPRWLRGTAA
jgi:hypothetical protein